MKEVIHGVDPRLVESDSTLFASADRIVRSCSGLTPLWRGLLWVGPFFVYSIAKGAGVSFVICLPIVVVAALAWAVLFRLAIDRLYGLRELSESVLARDDVRSVPALILRERLWGGPPAPRVGC